MAIQNVRMQQKRGEEANFDPDKMLPGEWAVSTDTKYVRMCFSPGVCVRMATYDAFEADMAQIKSILSEVQTIEEAVVRINTEVSENANAVVEYTALAKQYRDEAKQFRDEAETFTPDGYTELQETVASNTAKIDIIIEKAELNIKNTASGENIHLTDSANSKVVEFGLYGKAEQKQYSGKNLVDGIDLQCLASDTAEKSITNAVHLTVGTYTLSWVQSATLTGNVTRNTPTIRTLNNESSKNYQDTTPKRNLNAGRYYWTFSIKEENDYVFGYWMHSPGVDVTISNIQLESGSVMTDFEPYTNGASPNPDYPQEITVSGESYNLLENTATSQTINGVEFVVNEDGSVTANGTASARTSFILGKFKAKANKEYILSGVPTNTNGAKIVFNAKTLDYPSDSGSGKTIYSQTEIEASVYIEIPSGATVSNLTFYPMIRKASVKNDRYMPYGVGSVEVVSCGKNLASSEYINMYANMNVVQKFEISSSVQASLIRVKPNTTYLLGRKGGSQYSTVGFSEKEPVSGESYLSAIHVGSRETMSVTTPSNANYMLWYHHLLNNPATEIFCYETTETSAEYEPYAETTSTIPTPNGLCGIKVSSGGNYTDENGQQWIADEIVKYADGSGKRIQRIGKAVFDGSDDETWYLEEYTVNRFKIKLLGSKNEKVRNPVLCSHGFFGQSNTNGISFIFTEIFYFYNTDILTVEEFRTWLASNNVTVYYELATPIETDLTAEEIAEIEKLHTFYPVTNISNDSDCGMAVTYLADAKNYIDNRLALIETALVNSI